MTSSEISVNVPEAKLIHRIFGPSDEHLRHIRKTLSVQVTYDESSGTLLVRGEEENARKAAQLFEQLLKQPLRNEIFPQEDIKKAISEIENGDTVSNVKPLEVYGAKRIRPKTSGQARYVQMLRKKEVVFCVGPAGTGKTYLAVAKAVEALKSEKMKKIVLVRPAVEAGENLGFLPGTLQEKINPYLRPLFDALGDMIDRDILKRYMEEDRIEVIPLAYMRGRTLNDAYIILDEAQNTTAPQMKMFLTRMGEGSRIAVCGDMTQIDLPHHKTSGLRDAVTRLQEIKEIGMVYLDGGDIVRHDIVQKIVNAYEQSEGNRP